jgi:hypothetical protein
MSGGLMLPLSVRGSAYAEAAAQLQRFHDVETNCPWCGKPLADDPEQIAIHHSEAEIIFKMATRYAEDPQMWSVALFLVLHPGANDRELEQRTGMSKTKVNEARRRLRAIHPELAGAIDDTDHFVQGQQQRRETEGVARIPPPPQTGPLWWRVQDRFAQRTDSSRTQRIQKLVDNIEKVSP